MYDDQQQLRWKWEQDEPFGTNAADGDPASLGALDMPLRFPGQYADKETNFHYNYFRDYDPAQGRYVQSDPIGLLGSVQTYGYGVGAPNRYVDPSGESVALGGVIVAGGVLLIAAANPAIQKIASAILQNSSNSSGASPTVSKKSTIQQVCADCKETTPRTVAMAQAYAWAGITPGMGNQPVPWKPTFNFPDGLSTDSLAWAQFKQLYNAPYMGWWSLSNSRAAVEEHPFGHPGMPGQAWHLCPHFHATNSAGRSQPFPYAPGSP